jgi:hypothetical protein
VSGQHLEEFRPVAKRSNDVLSFLLSAFAAWDVLSLMFCQPADLLQFRGNGLMVSLPSGTPDTVFFLWYGKFTDFQMTSGLCGPTMVVSDGL